MVFHFWISLFAVFSLCLGHNEACGTNHACATKIELGISDFHSFSSPGYPNPYPPGTECRWTVISPENTTINLKCPKFNTRKGKKECLDLFYISEPSENNHNTVKCDNLTGHLIIDSSTNYLDILFSSFNDVNVSLNEDMGFKCVLQVKEKNTPKQEVVSDCGKKNFISRIVNGTEAVLHAWRWQVSLINTQYKDYQFCGGSLISSNWVLTAAHCVDTIPKDYLLVVLGDHNKETESETYHTIERYVSDIIIHNGYMDGWNNKINDIALLRLEQPVRNSHGVFPVCLPTNSMDSRFAEEFATVTGWGAVKYSGYDSDELLEVTLPIITNSDCSDMYKFSIYEDQICAYEEGKDSCSGDSGGPMVWQDEDHRYHQIGIVSWGEGCAKKDKPGVYTRVTSYIDWIEDKTNTLFSYRYNGAIKHEVNYDM